MLLDGGESNVSRHPGATPTRFRAVMKRFLRKRSAIVKQIGPGES